MRPRDTPPDSPVLVADRDPAMRRLLAQRLSREGFEVVEWPEPARTAEKLESLDPSLVLVELGRDVSFEPLLQIRNVSDVAVIGLLWAEPEADEVVALELGADDCMVRPFSLRHLVARTHAVLRRSRPATTARLRFNDLVIDPASRIVKRGERVIDLAAREFDLLVFMAARPGVAFTRDDLLVNVWRSSGEWQQRETVTEHIHRLRLRLEDDPSRPELLVTVRGVGYRFVPPVSS